ncbi:MAG: hypothetical protein NDI88_09845 [Lysobacter sp.]|nr:hypothetical protein [Lysobacter sp.]
MAVLRKPETLWPALWAAVIVALVAVIAAEHFLGRVTVGDEVRAPAKIVEAKLLPAFSLPAETQPVPETVARPLFVPTRRTSPPAATAAVATMKKGQFVLTGVTVTPEVSFAFLKEVAGGKTHSVKKGSQINGITIEAVEPRRVVMKQGEETEDLLLNTQVPARVAAAPAPTGAIPPAPGAAPVPPGTAVPPARTSPAGIVPPGFPGGTPPATAPAPSGTSPPASAATAPVSGRRRPWINAQ